MKRLSSVLMAAIVLLTVVFLTWDTVVERRRTTAPVLPEVQPESQMQPLPDTQPAQSADADCMVQLLHEGQILQVPLGVYLTAVLMLEMPASFEPAALQAQCVAARTYTLLQAEHPKHDRAQLCSDSACCQAWADTVELQKRFGDDFDAVWQNAAAAVEATTDQVLIRDGELITATYFSSSGGRTEAAVAVWGSDVPYLQAVESPGEQAPSGSSIVTMDAAEFARRLADVEGIDLTGEPAGWLGGSVRTEGGGVARMELGGVWLDGVALRQRFGLNSTCFELTYTDGIFRFAVSGSGHRVGMSQYGAQAMAQAGADYEQILLHYYTGVELSSAAALQ